MPGFFFSAVGLLEADLATRTAGPTGRVDHKQNCADWHPVGGVTAYEDIDTGFKP